ncbi:unnamed protein product [Effrenium voratum]|uniref:Guanylate cyclase domain-containing protein n=1 Tax=Effrenium voratum TaxID=2562239 RepID=A0AA36IDZ6_9DINO|nr:unnamed protein product [Effrenium voratum]
MNSWAVDSLPVVPMEVRSPAQAALELSREEVHNRPERRHDTSESGFAELLRDLSLTPPPVLDSQLSVPSASMPGSHPSQPSEPPPSEPPLPAGPPSPDLHHFSRQRSSEDPDRAGSEDVRRHSRRISWGDGGLPFDLVNNDYIKAMQHMYSNNLGGSWALNADDMRMLKEHSQYVDWTMEKNLQSLKDIRKVVRSIFWGFEDIQCQDDADAPAPVMTEDLLSRLKRLAQYTVEGKAFTLFYVFLTLYALFGPDTLLAAGHSGMDQDNLTLSIVNIFVFLAFVVEELLMCWVVPGYLFSLRFFMDTCATISILGDTAIAAEIINTDAAVAMRSSGVTRAMRGAGRSTRFVSVLRGLRVWQILKLLPRLQRLTESGTRELAMLMWHKRLQNVMGYIDKEGMGELNDEDMEFLTAALRLEFPAPPHEEAGCISRLVDKIQESGSRSSWTWPWRRKAQAVEPDLSRYSAEIHSCWDTDMGKRAFRRCLDDITTMKESCTVLYQSMLRLILKICIIVLALLLMLQFVSGSMPEMARRQGLALLESIDEQVPEAIFCEVVRDYFANSFQRCHLLMLVVNQKVFWNHTCECCEGEYHQYRNVTAAQAVALIDQAVDLTGLEAHEVLLEQRALSSLDTFSVFDVHQQSRYEAAENIKFTLSVVAMLAILMLYFSADIMHMSSNNCLHPLWDLMDDMNAMKLIELITVSTSFRKIEQETPLQSEKKRRCQCKAFSPVPVAQELLGLRKSMSLLESAMIAWSKYVPVILLKQVMNAGVEANIGCIPSRVSIFFCDIKGFKDTCKGKTPKEVLELLDVVLEGVNQALEQNGGTLLEFIGDEVLAVFNAPKKIEMHNLAAVNAALAAIENSAQLDEPVRLQCSVHTGEVLAGNIGAPTRMKYGLLGDGVNLAARLKSLNTRYGTQLLVSSETLQSSVGELFVARTVGRLILKGRTSPTHTLEVIGRKGQVPQDLEQAAEFHEEAAGLFAQGRFEEAKVLFEQASQVFVQYDEGSCPQDKPSAHMLDLCNMYHKNPPDLEKWDGSEHLNKKAWS